MDHDQLQQVDHLLDQIRSMKMHASRTLGAALKKPLLVLLLVSRIENNRALENRFTFDEIEKPLERHLRSSPFWKLHTQRQYRPGVTVLIPLL
jgi:hypothetical protein